LLPSAMSLSAPNPFRRATATSAAFMAETSLTPSPMKQK
jgi:hypothetical protein